jgi:hypothetical protein
MLSVSFGPLISTFASDFELPTKLRRESGPGGLRNPAFPRPLGVALSRIDQIQLQPWPAGPDRTTSTSRHSTRASRPRLNCDFDPR